MIDVMGLMTQLKISFRQISTAMASDTRPSSPRRGEQIGDPGAARAPLRSSVWPRDLEVDDARFAEDRAELRDRAQHEAAAAERVLDDLFAAQSRSGRTG